MSRMSAKDHRKLQDLFGTRAMADYLEATDFRETIDDASKRFIEGRDMMFLATLDHEHRPTVSYKGGDPGFLKVPDPRTVLFPSYDGNGMYLSMGNIDGQGEVGMLFIDFEVPRRLRLQGMASVSDDPALTGLWKEAELAIRVSVTGLWVNCPRYVHRYRKVKASRHVPRRDGDTPFAGWKRIDTMSPVLNEQERAEVDRLGPISEAQWVAMVDTGDEDA